MVHEEIENRVWNTLVDMPKINDNLSAEQRIKLVYKVADYIENKITHKEIKDAIVKFSKR